MAQRDGDVLFDCAPADSEFGGDLGMRQAIDLVAAEHAHRALGWSGERGGQMPDAFAARDCVEGGGRIVDRLGARD